MNQDVDKPTAVACLPAGRIEYRLDRRGDAVVVVFHGGHTRAGLPMAKPSSPPLLRCCRRSRPGYGRTPLSTGRCVQRYSDAVRDLCAHLSITRITAVVGISGGGPTAATMAARHTDLVERLILVSAVSWLSYPGRLARLGAHMVFAAGTEAVTWAAIHALGRWAPDLCLRFMLNGLSTRPVDEVVGALRAEDRDELHIFRPDAFRPRIPQRPSSHAGRHRPDRPTHARHRHAHRRRRPVPHAQSLASTIPNAQLIESRAHTHLVWLGPDWPAIAETIRLFLHTKRDRDGAQ